MFTFDFSLLFTDTVSVLASRWLLEAFHDIAADSSEDLFSKGVKLSKPLEVETLNLLSSKGSLEEVGLNVLFPSPPNPDPQGSSELVFSYERYARR